MCGTLVDQNSKYVRSKQKAEKLPPNQKACDLYYTLLKTETKIKKIKVAAKLYDSDQNIHLPSPPQTLYKTKKKEALYSLGFNEWSNQTYAANK